MILTWNLTRETQKAKKIKHDVVLTNYDVIVIFPIDGQFGAIQNPIPITWSIIFKFSLTVIFYLAKTENRTEGSLIQLSYISLSKAIILAKYNTF